MGPEVAFVLAGLALTGNAVWLAGEAADDGIDHNSVCCQSGGGEFADILVAPHVGPVFRQHPPGKRFDFAERNSFKPARPGEAEIEATDPRK